MKRILSVLLTVAMLFAFAIPTMAATNSSLKDSHLGPYTVVGQEPSGEVHYSNALNPKGLNTADDGDEYVLWHFTVTDVTSGCQTATVTFGEVSYSLTAYHPSGDTTKSTLHYAIITPANWILTAGNVFGVADQFNLSHTSYGPGMGKGSLKVNINALQKHKKITIQPVWQRTIQPVWQKKYQTYEAPVFIKDVSTGGKDTLVTRLEYNNDTKKATPTNGGIFQNGHTYVAVDVAEASAEGGIWYTIADSSKNNGNKVPADYNRPIDYEYNVKIEDGKLTITFDDRLVSANVGAYVVADLGNDANKAFPGSAPTHYNGSVTVNVPENGGTVYLYTHIEGGSLSWYTTGEYEFVRWEIIDRMDLKCDCLVRNDQIKDEKLRDDVTKEIIAETFVGEFDLVVTDESSEVVYNNKITNGDTNFVISNLTPGEYTLTMTGNNIESQYKTVTVVAGSEKVVDFDNIVVWGEKEKTTLEKIYADDIDLEKTYLDAIILPPVKVCADCNETDPEHEHAIKLN